jgi:hypothetical protein
VVLKYVDDDHLLARVVQGDLLVGDIVRQGQIACLPVSAEERCR